MSQVNTSSKTPQSSSRSTVSQPRTGGAATGAANKTASPARKESPREVPTRDEFKPSSEKTREERETGRPRDRKDETGPCDKKDKKDNCDKTDKCDKKDKCDKGDRIDQILDCLKDIFEELKKDKCGPSDDKKGGGGCGGGGGGDKGAGGCGGAKGAGGCGGAKGAGDGQDEADPIEELTIALDAVEQAKCPRKKAEAKEALKEVYSEVKEMGVDIPKPLEARIKRALGQGGGCGDRRQDGNGGRNSQNAQQPRRNAA